MSVLTIIPGDDKHWLLSIRNADGTPKDITGSVFDFVVKPEYSSPDAQALFSDHITDLDDPENGDVLLAIAADDSAEVPFGSHYFYVKWREAHGQKRTITTGALIAYPDRDEDDGSSADRIEITLADENILVVLEESSGPQRITTNTATPISGLLKGKDGKVAQAMAGTDFEAAGSASRAVSNHGSAPNPHPQYATVSDLSAHTGDTNNPHVTTASQVGADPVGSASAAQAAAQSYADGLVAHMVDTESDQDIPGVKTMKKSHTLWVVSAASITVGDGISNDTLELDQIAAAAIGRRLDLQPDRVYLVDYFNPRAGTLIFGHGAIVRRRSSANAPFMLSGDGCIMEDLSLDGNKGNIAAPSAPKMSMGLRFGANNKLRNVKSYNHYGAGIANVLGTGDSVVEDCVAYGNGINPGDSGTGDGIYIVNGNDIEVRNCHAYNNARSGVAVTTYDIVTGQTDRTLSNRTKIIRGKYFDNEYNDVNAEQVTDCTIDNPYSPIGVTFRGSLRTRIKNFTGACIFGDQADYAFIDDCYLNKADGQELIYITGKSPAISNVVCEPTGAALSGNCVEVMPSDSKGTLRGIRVVRAATSFRINVDEASNLRSESATNVHFTLGSPGNQTNVNIIDRISKGIYYVISSQKPTTGNWPTGSRVDYNTPTAGGYAGALCIAYPHNFKEFGQIEA